VTERIHRWATSSVARDRESSASSAVFRADLVCPVNGSLGRDQLSTFRSGLRNQSLRDLLLIHWAQGVNRELALAPWQPSRMRVGVTGEVRARSADEAHAQRGDGQALQDGAGDDDAMPVALQSAGVARCLVGVGSGGECAVDRRADAQVEHR